MRFIFSIIGKLIGVAFTIFILWIVISVILGIGAGIMEMPYEDGPIDGCENIKETLVKQKEVIKDAWDATPVPEKEK